LLFLLESTVLRDSVKRTFSLYQNKNRVTTTNTLRVILDKNFFKKTQYFPSKNGIQKKINVRVIYTIKLTLQEEKNF